MRHGERCPCCDRVWFDGTTDFGGDRDRAFLLKPTGKGGTIEVRVGGDLICVVTREEMQGFLNRVYGPASS